ncbi:MAG: (Fe-S)-binding protein, partial [Acidobacteriota bacterium]|nr:(Fe-S)-binding protein [Acidobacteriota bacterium]
RLLSLVLRHVWLHPRRLRLAFAASRLFRDMRLARLLLASKLPRLVSPRLELALALLDSSSPADLRRDDGQGARAGQGGEIESRSTETSAARAGSDAQPGTGSRAKGESQAEAGSHGDARRVQLFKGCVTRGLFARVNAATERVLGANGCRVEAPGAQVCCGALHAHAGDLEGARTLARRNVDAFEYGGAATVVTNAGGCGAMLVSYAHLLEDDAEYAERALRFSARVRDVSQQLAATGAREGAPISSDLKTTYDASCHLLHGQRAFDEPLRLFASIPRLGFVALEGSDVCCGGAGVYNLLETDLSSRVLGEKLKHVEETGAAVLMTGNPGCHMQIAAGARLAGLRLRVCHPVELLDESYRRAGFYE